MHSLYFKCVCDILWKHPRLANTSAKARRRMRPIPLRGKIQWHRVPPIHHNVQQGNQQRMNMKIMWIGLWSIALSWSLWGNQNSKNAGCLRATNACFTAASHLLLHHWKKLRKVKSTRTGSPLIHCTTEPMKSTARETLRYTAESNAAIRVTSRHWHHQCDDSGSNTPDIESSLCLFTPMFASCHRPMNKPRTMYMQSQVSIHKCTSKGTWQIIWQTWHNISW